jgi:hypothetical protein
VRALPELVRWRCSSRCSAATTPAGRGWNRSRSATRPAGSPSAREASLRQRNTTLLAENRRLRDQIAELKAELAIAYGQRRAAH